MFSYELVQRLATDIELLNGFAARQSHVIPVAAGLIRSLAQGLLTELTA